MFDAAHAIDTIVVEDPDASTPAPPAIGRVATAELTMQVQVLGAWHRRTPDLRETACGVPFHSEFTTPRREVLTMEDRGPLCPECFTPHELARARELDAAAAAAREEEERKLAEKDAERSRRRWKTPSQGDR